MQNHTFGLSAPGTTKVSSTSTVPRPPPLQYYTASTALGVANRQPSWSGLLASRTLSGTKLPGTKNKSAGHMLSRLLFGARAVGWGM